MLADPAQEARAEVARELRCVVCQSESLADSEADIAHDLRLMLRERIAAGDSDQQVRDFLVARYGEFVLFRPPFTARNAALWLSGPVLLVAGGAIAFGFIRRRARAPAPARPPLTPEEEARLRELTRADRVSPRRPAGLSSPRPKGCADGLRHAAVRARERRRDRHPEPARVDERALDPSSVASCSTRSGAPPRPRERWC